MIGDLLELVDLGDKRDDYVQTLSRGMQQRLCLAHALVHDPAGAAPRRAGLRPRPAGPGRAARAAPRAALAGQDDPHQQPHPARARGAVHERGHRRSRPGARPGPRLRHRAAAPLRGRPAGPRPARTARPSRPPATASRPTPDVASAAILDDGTIELGFRGDDAASARLLADVGRRGLPIVSFARAASDLEELFLQVTAPDREPLEAA